MINPNIRDMLRHQLWLAIDHQDQHPLSNSAKAGVREAWEAYDSYIRDSAVESNKVGVMPYNNYMESRHYCFRD